MRMVIRIDFEGLFELFQGLIVLARIFVSNGEIGARSQIQRVQFQGALEMRELPGDGLPEKRARTSDERGQVRVISRVRLNSFLHVRNSTGS